MNKYSKFSTTPIVPSDKMATSVQYVTAKPAAPAKHDEPAATNDTATSDDKKS